MGVGEDVGGGGSFYIDPKRCYVLDVTEFIGGLEDQRQSERV